MIGQEALVVGLGSTTFFAIAHINHPAYTAIQVAPWKDAAPSGQ
jgi:hypothetical protein